MAHNLEAEMKEERPKFPKNLFLLFPKLPFNRKRSVEVVIEKRANEKKNKADVVRFSEARPAVPPPLKLEAEEGGSTSNRIILWQNPPWNPIFLNCELCSFCSSRFSYTKGELEGIRRLIFLQAILSSVIYCFRYVILYSKGTAVYAIGGFLLLKWIWARWKERKEMGSKNESSDDEQPPAAADDS